MRQLTVEVGAGESLMIQVKGRHPEPVIAVKPTTSRTTPEIPWLSQFVQRHAQTFWESMSGRIEDSDELTEVPLEEARWRIIDEGWTDGEVGQIVASTLTSSRAPQSL